VGGGVYNRVLQGGSVIAGGLFNTISNEESVISGGTDNTVSGLLSTIGGGWLNTISSNLSTVSGGQNNTASVGSHATVVGGFNNVSSGQYSISGGRVSQASGGDSISLGRQNIVSGIGSVAIGGYLNSISGYRAFGFGSYNIVTSQFGSVLGHYTKSYLYGQSSFANGSFDNNQGDGDAQASQLVARKSDTLTTGGITVLSLDGTGTTNLIVPTGNNRLWSVKVTATAFVSAVSGTTLVLGDSYMGEYTILFKKVGGVSSVVGVTGGPIISDTNMSTAAFNFSAGASQELSIIFVAPTTANADTFRCVAKVEIVEVAY